MGEEGPQVPIKLPAASPILRVDFEPPAGKLLTERAVTSVVETPPGADPSQSRRRSAEAVFTTRYEPADSRTWVLTQSVSETTATLNGKPYLDKLARAMARLTLRIRLTSDGVFVRLLNPNDAREALRAQETPEDAEALATLFGPDAIEEQARKEWDSKYFGLFNRTLNIGATFYSLQSFAVGRDREVTYLLERTVQGTTPSQFGEAVVLTLRCLGGADRATDPQAARLSVLESEQIRLEPTVECSGQQLLARRPFVPVKSWMKLSAQPAEWAGGALTLEKSLTATKLE
jgi:hypothetical protein